MLPRMAKAIVVVAVLVGAELPGFAAETAPNVQPIEFNGGTASLSGQWKYHIGDNTAWASPDFDDSSWAGISSDKPWGSQRRFDEYGISWYRVRIALGASSPRELAVLFPAVENAYEVYWNGRFVGSCGKLPPWPQWYQGLWTETFGLGRAGEGVLAVRVWKSPYWFNRLLGDPRFQPILGSPEAVTQAKAAADFKWLQSNQYLFGSISLMGLICALGVIGWLRDRKQWVLLWMALFAFVPCGALFLWILKTLRNPLAGGIFFLVQSAGDISIILLLLWLVDLDRDQRLVRTVYLVCVGAGVASILRAFCFFGLTLQDPRPALIGWTVLFSFALSVDLFPLYLIAVAIKQQQRLDYARWMVVVSSSLVLMITTFGGIIAIVGQFFGRDLSGVWWTPIAVVWGNPINPLGVALPVCVLTVFYAVYRYTAVNRRRQIALEEEFKSAREIQSLLIPERLPGTSGIEVTSAYRPVREVGGDFFQVLPLEGGSTLIVLGDVSGKGLKAAMPVSLIVGMLKTLVRYTSGPAELLTALNRSVHGQLQGGFATCIVLRADYRGRCLVVNAGHPPPFLNGRELVVPGALPVGITPDATYEETHFQMAEGDNLALYTDGLLEARNGAGELYGFDRLRVLLSSKPTATEAAEAAVAFGQDDDVTVLTLTRLPVVTKSLESTDSAPLYAPPH
jgi:hypothetical protein